MTSVCCVRGGFFSAGGAERVVSEPARLAGKETDASLNFAGSRASSNRNLPQIPSALAGNAIAQEVKILYPSRVHAWSYERVAYVREVWEEKWRKKKAEEKWGKIK